MNKHTEYDFISINELRTRLAAMRGGKKPSYNSIYRAIRVSDMPSHHDPFNDRLVFNWMEIVDWLAGHRIPLPDREIDRKKTKADDIAAIANKIVRGAK